MIDNEKLSKTISHALRHEPWAYELELDNEGWVLISQLLESLRHENGTWQELVERDVAEMIRKSSKPRHEIKDGRIRAIYGHSIPGKLKREAAAPPESLFHGTNPDSVASIRTHGLKPMERQNVHLSVDEAMMFIEDKVSSAHLRISAFFNQKSLDP